MARKKKTITDALGRERSATRESWGKLRTLPSGRYQASYIGPDGLRYNGPKTYDAMSDARGWLTAQRVLIQQEKWQPPTVAAAAEAERARTLGDYAKAWLSERTNARGDHLRPRTQAEYRRLLDGPLADLVATPLGSITSAKVRTWRAAQLATGRKTQTSRAYGLLNAIMVTAEGDRLIESNPCTIKGGQATHTGRKVVPPTDDELDAILSAMPEQWRALVWLAAGGGLRWGEATELRRKDVTVERDDDGAVVRALVNVERAVTVSSELPDALPHGAHRCDCRRGCLVGEPKSAAGMRSLYVYGDAAEALADHLARHALRFGNPLLFPALGDDSGQRHLSQSTFHTPAWSDAREAARRADMPFHALRHYSATAYSQAGATPAENNRRHGWSSVTVGMRYQHAGNRDEELAARMARRSTSA